VCNALQLKRWQRAVGDPKTGTALEACVVSSYSSTTVTAVIECFCELTSVPHGAEVRMFSHMCTGFGMKLLLMFSFEVFLLFMAYLVY